MCEPILFTGTSIIDNHIINDSDIFLHIGYENYVILNRKYPYYFKFFNECNTKNDKIGKIPGYLDVFFKYSIEEIKKDIIKTIYYKKYISEISDLVINFKICDTKPKEFENTISIWIFICIIIVSLLFFSVYILVKSEKINKIIKFKN